MRAYTARAIADKYYSEAHDQMKEIMEVIQKSVNDGLYEMSYNKALPEITKGKLKALGYKVEEAQDDETGTIIKW